MTAAELHREMHTFLLENGWTREDPGSGWYWTPQRTCVIGFGEAVQDQLIESGIDVRQNPQVVIEPPPITGGGDGG